MRLELELLHPLLNSGAHAVIAIPSLILTSGAYAVGTGTPSTLLTSGAHAAVIVEPIPKFHWMGWLKERSTPPVPPPLQLTSGTHALHMMRCGGSNPALTSVLMEPVKNSPLLLASGGLLCSQLPSVGRWNISHYY
jgi:hypothetical protein